MLAVTAPTIAQRNTASVDSHRPLADNSLNSGRTGFCGTAEVQMSLQDDLKARTLALISQQMANWVVEIQRQINDRQASLVRSLDDLQETVAAYDERISEPEIEAAIAEV